jgi:hypothetical protein
MYMNAHVLPDSVSNAGAQLVHRSRKAYHRANKRPIPHRGHRSRNPRAIITTGCAGRSIHGGHDSRRRLGWEGGGRKWV